MSRHSYVAGNWKMNTTAAEAAKLAQDLRAKLEGVTGCEVAVFPPFLSIAAAQTALAGSNISVGSQNVHWEKSGAFTGEVSAAMLTASGINIALIGHSERRQYFGETDATVNKRTKAALAGGLSVIVCVGETLNERQTNVTQDVVRRQIEGAFDGIAVESLAKITVAYEPVWAIGTGLTATPAQAQEVHAFIRGLIGKLYGAAAAEALRIQYGGSVNAANAKELLSQPDIDGALVGGAALKPADFDVIVRAAK